MLEVSAICWQRMLTLTYADAHADVCYRTGASARGAGELLAAHYSIRMHTYADVCCIC